MEPDHLNSADLEPLEISAVNGYLDQLRSQLATNGRTKRAILAEVFDGLACAITDRRAQGQDAATAVRESIVEFGDATTLARQFNRQQGRTLSHLAGVGLLLSGPLVGLAWLAAYGGARSVSAGLHALLDVVPALAVLLPLTVPAALIAATGAGWPARHVPMPPRWSTRAAFVALIGCVTADATLLASAAFAPASTSLESIVCVVASLLRLILTAWAAWRLAGLAAASG